MYWNHECDCGRRYSNLDALMACQNANHGVPRPPSEAQIEAAAEAMMHHMFAPHELPLDDELRAKYRECAKAALEAAR